MDYEFQPLYTAGEVYISSVIDMLTAQAYYIPHIVKIMQHLLTGSGISKLGELKGRFPDLNYSNLYQIAVPEEFYEKAFQSLFLRLLNDNIIAIGLYRMQGATDNPYHYTYTNPS